MPATPLKILLIEDDQDDANLIRKMLAEIREPEFAVQVAQLLRDGLELLEARSFDIVLVDLGLPDCRQGLDAALKVRDKVPRTPVMVLTGLEDEEIALKSWHLDIQDYLIKGEFNAPLLSRSIRNAIQRKQDIEALRESEQRYRTLFNAIDTAFCIIQMIFDAGRPVDYRFLETNQAFDKHTGLSDVDGRRILDLLPGYERHWFEMYGQVALTGQQVRFESQSVSLNRWFDVFAFRFGAPEKHQVAVQFNDITERKAADQKLRESEAKFSKAFHAAPILISLSTLNDGRYLDVNEEFARTLQFERDDIIGRTSGELGIWDSPKVREELVEKLRAKEKIRDFATNLRTSSGQVVNGLLSLEAVEIQGAECLLTITRDVTALKRAEEDRTRLALIVESSEDAIIGKTLDGTITSWNRGAQKIYGFNAEEMKGRHISLLTPDSLPDEIEGILEAIRGGKTIERLETTRVRKDGSLIPVALTISPIRDEQGRVVGASTIARDISERRRAEEEIVRLNTDLAARATELETANRDLHGFNYTVAHDLRQPLTVISSFCQAIEAFCGSQLSEECSEYLKGIYDGVFRMNRLIDALLDFARMAHAELRRQTVNLSLLGREVFQEFMLAEPRRKVQVTIPDQLLAFGDANLLRMVLHNLLGNAWKFTGNREIASIELGVREGQPVPVFFVKDNGEGFDREHAGRIFSPFQRLPGAEQFRGFGVGLATVERIIKRHGGTVWAEGEPGRGATFFFTLPPAAENHDPGEPSP